MPIDRRAFLTGGVVLTAAGLSAGTLARVFGQEEGENRVTLEPGESATVDCAAPTTTTVPPSSTSTTLPPATTVTTAPTTTTTAPETTTTQPSTTTTVPPSTGLTALHVEGQQIRDANGGRVLLAGINNAYAIPGYLWQGSIDFEMITVNAWYQRNRHAHAADWASRGVRYIRLPYRNDPSSGYAATVRDYVAAMTARGIYVGLVAFGDFGNFPAGAQAAAQRFLGLWDACGRNPGVLFETWNEPHEISNDAWLSGQRTAIQTARNGGYTGLIICDGQGWAWSFPKIQARQLVAEDPNLCFASHRYASDTVNYRGTNDWQPWVNEWRTTDLCVILNEMGPYNENFGNGGSFVTNVDGWCSTMTAAGVQGVRDGWLQGWAPWTYLWGDGATPANEMISPADGTGGWWEIAGENEPYILNRWGDQVFGGIAQIRMVA